jgi:MYXO-CTERM domain-containing protein
MPVPWARSARSARSANSAATTGAARGWLPLALAVAATLPAHAIVVDTGPGADVGGGWSLYDDRPASPGFQRLAARFELDAPDVVRSVQGWLNWDFGGALRFAVWSDYAGLPGRPLHEVTAWLTPTGPNQPDWRGVGGLDWALAAGSHWLVFEDAPGPGNGAMPGGAASPLAAYASGPGLQGAPWMRGDTLGFGVRINTLPEPPPPPIPEPATAWLWLAGALALGAALRRRRGG